MDDRLIMDNILTPTKGICNLMMHGAIESATPYPQDVLKAIETVS